MTLCKIPNSTPADNCGDDPTEPNEAELFLAGKQKPSLKRLCPCESQLASQIWKQQSQLIVLDTVSNFWRQEEKKKVRVLLDIHSKILLAVLWSPALFSGGGDAV